MWGEVALKDKRMMQGYMKENQDWWNEAAQVHAGGEGYLLKEFREGMIKLHPLEREEVGDARGKKLLHLQCHFGMDTLSWARLGAEVTGVDYAEKAIGIAQSLAQELGLEATFICSDIYRLPEALPPQRQFDIVFTSYGAVCWLPDLRPWGKMIADYLKPGGFFYIAEGHPFMWSLDEHSTEFKVGYPYFSKEAIRDESSGTYAEKEAKLEHNVTYGWNHTLSEIFTSLLSPGLRLDFFHEHAFCAWEPFPDMEEGEDRLFRFKDPKKREMIPLMYSLKATKP
jgi:SAM-dependent methyltransferase